MTAFIIAVQYAAAGASQQEDRLHVLRAGRYQLDLLERGEEDEKRTERR